ncbi:hypothetical protein M758_6G100100 [Ceratodon purpureus]|nr:hypothetical protein M758_6G100100 [Ceratodon purpureus]
MGNLSIFSAFVVTLLAHCVFVAQAATEPATGGAAGEPVKHYPFHWIKVHGWLMWLGMGLLMPVAIVMVRFSQQARARGDLKTVRTLVYAHIFIQVIAVLAVICSAVVAIMKFDNNFHYTHERLGLALWILVWLAPLVGFIRPDHGMKSRPAWYAAHWLFGTAGVLLGFYNIYTGLHAYELMSGKSLRTLNILFSIQLSIVAFIYLTQDRYQYFKEQGRFSKSVTPMYNDQKPKDEGLDARTQGLPNV